MNTNNPFAKFLGPMPGDPPPYKQPEGAAEFKPADLTVVTHVRLELAKRQDRLYKGERK